MINGIKLDGILDANYGLVEVIKGTVTIFSLVKFFPKSENSSINQKNVTENYRKKHHYFLFFPIF